MRFTSLCRRAVIVSLVATVCAAATLPARAALVKDISTGIDPFTGAKVPNGQRQSAYAIAPGGTGGQVGTRIVAWSGPIPPYGYPGTYAPDEASAASRWISIFPEGAPNPIVGLGTYFYQTSVDLTGFDPATAVIASPRFAVDDAFRGVRVNGVTVFTPPPPGYYSNMDSFANLPSTLGSGAFHAGLNTVTLIVENVVDQSPASIRFEGRVTATPVPEPAAAGAVGMTVAGWLLRRRRRGE